MSLTKLQRNFEERRQSLIETLQKTKSELPLSKQHQLYGAIKEIENFLKAIEFHREEQVSTQDFELKREGPHPLARRAKRAARKTGTGIARIGRGIYFVCVTCPGRAFRNARKQRELKREIQEEVERRMREQR